MAKRQFLGFQFGREDENRYENVRSVTVPQDDDGAINVSAFGGAQNQYIDIDLDIRTENQLIDKYREVSLFPEVNRAVDMITSESIIISDTEQSVKPNLDQCEDLSDDLKEKIQEAHDEVMSLLHFSIKGHDIFRQFYIDGRIYYHIMIDEENPDEGIQEIRFLDPKKTRKIREINVARKSAANKNQSQSLLSNKDIREYYLYYPNGTAGENTNGRGFTTAQSGDVSAIRMTTDSVAYANSGEQDYRTGLVTSFLHKAIRSANNLKMIEDSVIIYSLSRAPERRVFYIDTGTLPNRKASEYVNKIKNQYRTKISFDANTGAVKDNPRHLAITEDYFLPRREGSRGTEIDTLQGGCLAMDTKVSLLDGRELSIEEIKTEMDEGKELWTYSVNPETGAIVPGLISWAGVTQESAEVMRLAFDNGGMVTCTPDHKFPVHGKGFVRADELDIDDTLMSVEREKTIAGDVNINVIEYLDDRIQVGTLTIDQDEIYHDYHTFALSCGVFTKNSQLGEVGHADYFRDKLLNSLYVPKSRFDDQPSMFDAGTQITRDEVYFQRFVDRLRRRFSLLLLDLLGKQLILTGVFDSEDWNQIKNSVVFDFLENNYFAEMSKIQIMQSRFGLLQAAGVQQPIGQFVSNEWASKNILQMTDEEIEEERKKIEDEKKSGIIPPPEDGSGGYGGGDYGAPPQNPAPPVQPPQNNGNDGSSEDQDASTNDGGETEQN